MSFRVGRSSVSLLLLVAVGCGGSDAERATAPAAPPLAQPRELGSSPLGSVSPDVPRARHSVAQAPGTFQRLPADWTGVDLQHDLDGTHPMRRLYHSGFVCGGVAIGDVTGDQLPDLFFVNSPGSNRLYRNLGECRFEDISAAAGIEGGDTWGTGATLVDIDNDADLDIYVGSYDAPNQLYINQGGGRFTEAARAWGLDIVDATLMPTFADIDRDGDLDLYLLNNRYYRDQGRPATRPWEDRDGKPVVLPEYEQYFALQQLGPNKYTVEEYGRPDRLLLNNGDGTFRDVTSAAGIRGHGFGLSATWWDENGDGFPDLYVCNDFNDPDRMYRNNGDGTFTDVLAETMPHTPWFSMGSDAGDLNNDGLLDLLAVDMSATNHYKQKTTMGAMSAAKLAQVAGPPPQLMRNALYINTGTGRFLEAAFLANLGKTDWSWSIKMADLDHDGKLDVFVSNGMVRSFNDSDVIVEDRMLIGRTHWDLYADQPTRPEQNLAYRNLGELAFEDVSQRWGLDHVGMSYGTALADLDGDHDLDLVVVNMDEPVSIYRNDVAQSAGLIVQLQGSVSNRGGIGAQVTYESAGERQVRYLIPVTGFLASNEPVVHFGVPANAPPGRLTVRWPSGRSQVIEDVAGGQRRVVVEPASSTAAPDPRVLAEPLYQELPWLTAARHREAPFDDFQLQPLLPNRLSQYGPGIAFADIDSDGDEDAYLGGAAGQAGWLLINQAPGQMTPRVTADFEADAACEDLGCLFFDLEGDEDLDLYVVSGGVEAQADPARYSDRLYLNDSQGNFQRASESVLPADNVSGGCVAACDFDRDGDLDLFVGGRLVPGDYPLSPRSVLLRNDQGRLSDVTGQVAPELVQSGMVTGAVWSDADGDGWSDLWVTHEWGPVKLFHNQAGRLVERTSDTGLSPLTGWWNGIAARDVDGDQDLDYVVTNFGLNTKYHASAHAPALLYYGDFEGNGNRQLIEAELEDERLVPIRGRSCSSQAMPSLRQRFTSYHDFALADLTSLYSARCLQESQRFAATTLESGVLINQGELRFEFQPLPRLAQISPAFGVVCSELTGDAAADIYLVQNFFGPQPETGPMDSGLSLLLAGRGDGTFRPVWPRDSGLIVTGDAKALATADLDGDGIPELVTSVNNGQPRCFRARAPASLLVSVRLRGPRGNREGVGARVSVYLRSGAAQTAEVLSGGGYLSQSARSLVFGAPVAAEVERIEVRWPDGGTTSHPGDGSRSYLLSQPTL